MKTIERIEELLIEYNDDKFKSLWSICKNIVESVIQHNKQINTQMSNYDIHDEAHSEKVIEILENLVGENINSLTCYELILLYLSAYLHDSAMALPQWEYDVLKAVEGTEETFDNTLSFKICNDFKPVHKLCDAVSIIKAHQKELFKYEEAKNYIFAQDSEETMIMSLAELLCSYEEFRNGYIDELRSHSGSVSEYINMSKLIRSEYIRQTHHIRVVNNANALKNKFSNIIGSMYAEKLVFDLGEVCKCHGEDIESIFCLECCREDWTRNKSNIQFVAMLLRLGDVIHFSSDRAPLSLFAEKRIEDETSFMHWKAKFQELTFDFYKEKEYIEIKYKAFCSGPEVYYFIQDYLNWVDLEIRNYYMLKQRWEQKNIDNIENYILLLADKVNRRDIDYNKEVFIPNPGMKFSLDHSKVLELLMGKQLYKDEFLCLREIYQNSLDATKSMIAYNKSNDISESLKIEFGIGEEFVGGVKQKYIYCLDHGTGMDEFIINNFLLNIGNSYYKSKEFSKKNTAWGFKVNPTSQFGIGILSGYMIADRIGITTIYYENSKVESFVLEGINEHFYNVPSSKLDIESIGKHGTLVKLYLKKEFFDKINTEYNAKLPVLLMTNNNDTRREICDITDLNYNLAYILTKYIGIFNSEIPVCVKHSDGITRNIFQSNIIFDVNEYDEVNIEDLEKIWKEYHYMDGSPNPYKEVIEKLENIENYPIKIASENIELYSHISLPKKDFDSDNLKLFGFCHFVGNNEGTIWVDGIKLNKDIHLSDSIEQILGYEIVHNSVINYIGKVRPTLSVDRNSCVDMPSLDEEYEQIKDMYAAAVKDIIYGHVQKYNIGIGDYEFTLILNIIVTHYAPIASKVFNSLCDTEYSKANFPDIILSGEGQTLESFLRNEVITINNTNFTRYKEITRQIVLSKCMKAVEISVNDDALNIKGNNVCDFHFSRYSYRQEDSSLSTVAIKADAWEGKYKEYDLVNTLWPIVNPNLYNSLHGYEIQEISERCKTISETGNGIQGMAKLNPTMINPIVGISSVNKDRFSKRKCLVGEFDKIEHGYWLFELSDHGKDIFDLKKSYVLFEYVAPRELNELEIMRLSELEETDPTYAKGVREGWSILFLGKMGKYIICPGIVTKEYIISLIPESFKGLDPDIEYYSTDGSKVF